MTIGETLEALIEDGNISITELSQKIGVNRRQITRWEKNEAEMGTQKLKMICEIYQVSADYVLGLPKGLHWPR